MKRCEVKTRPWAVALPEALNALVHELSFQSACKKRTPNLYLRKYYYMTFITALENYKTTERELIKLLKPKVDSQTDLMIYFAFVTEEIEFCNGVYTPYSKLKTPEKLESYTKLVSLYEEILALEIKTINRSSTEVAINILYDASCRVTQLLRNLT